MANEVGERSHAAFLARRTFRSLDGLRCVAIVTVVWHHAHGGYAALPATRHGFLGVDLFFVISGFLITTLLLRERARTGTISLKNFYARRTLRIFPPYYAILAALALVLLFARPGAPMRPAFFAELPWCLTYTTNWVEPTTLLSITWSLSAEEQFYLLWPPVERFLPRHALKVLLLLIVVNQCVNFRLADGALHSEFGFGHDDRKILQATFTPICLGVLLAHLLDDPRGWRRLAPRLGPAAAWLATAGIVAAASIDGDLSGWPRLALHLLMTVLLGSVVVAESGAVARVLAWRPLQKVGAVSYGMYLLHLIVLDLVLRLDARIGPTNRETRFVLCAALTLVAALLMYRWFERPILAFKARFAS
jgi:peptidoglycan/LPS O-acetylase OafA/YrhL